MDHSPSSDWIDDKANLWIKGAIGLMSEACKGSEMKKKFRLR